MVQPVPLLYVIITSVPIVGAGVAQVLVDCYATVVIRLGEL